MTVTYTIGDTRDVIATIPDGSVSLIATSPPFIALRSYLPADHPDKHAEIGSEPDPATFIDTLLELTAEWGRVLAPWGSIAIELGDTYSGSSALGGDCKPDGEWTKYKRGALADAPPVRGGSWPRAKCLALVPQAYALSLAYGRNVLSGQPSPAGQWLVRNVITWHRPNPAVGALGDKYRPSTSQIVVATRSAKRWFDLTAVRDSTSNTTRLVGGYAMVSGEPCHDVPARSLNPAGAPPLDAWFDEYDGTTDTWTLTTQPSKLAHYAMWPAKLAERLILSMCPVEVCTGLVCKSCRHSHDGLNTTTLDAFTMGEQGLPIPPAVQEELRHLRDLLRGSEPVDVQRPMSLQALDSETRKAHELQRRTDQPPRVHPPLDAGLHMGDDGEGVRSGASLRDGAELGAAAGEVGTRPPQERTEGRQPSGEPSNRDEREPSRLGDVSALRAWILDALTCPCGSSGFTQCGEPRRRVEAKTPEYAAFRQQMAAGEGLVTAWDANVGNRAQGFTGSAGADSAARGPKYVTEGWSDCGCGAPFTPGTVLDPFVGSGTTCCVAELHGRNSIGIDLDSRNRDLLDRRMAEVSRNLFDSPMPDANQLDLFGGVA